MNINIIIGRFNPIHIGHYNIIRHMIEDFDGKFYIATTATCDNEKNPLSFEEKIKYISNAVEPLGVEVLGKPVLGSYDCVKNACFECQESGGGTVTLICGDDRLDSYTAMCSSLLEKYQDRGECLDIELEVRSMMSRDSDEAFSATEMRDFAKTNDVHEFVEHCPPTMDEDVAINMFRDVRRALSLTEAKTKDSAETEKTESKTSGNETEKSKNEKDVFEKNFGNDGKRDTLEKVYNALIKIKYDNPVKAGEKKNITPSQAVTFIENNKDDCIKEGFINNLSDYEENGNKGNFFYYISDNSLNSNKNNLFDYIADLKRASLEKASNEAFKNAQLKLLVDYCTDDKNRVLCINFCEDGKITKNIPKGYDNSDGKWTKFINLFQNHFNYLKNKAEVDDAKVNRADDVNGTLIIFIKPNGNLVASSHNNSETILQNAHIDTSDRGIYISGASIYSKIENGDLKYYYKTGNEGDRYESDVASNINLLFSDGYTITDKNKTISDSDITFTKDNSNLSNLLGDGTVNAITNLFKTAKANGLYGTGEGVLTRTILEKQFDYCFEAKYGKDKKTPPLEFDKNDGTIIVKDIGVDNLEASKSPVAPVDIGGKYVMIHAGGKDSKVEIPFNECISLDNIDDKLAKKFKPYQIADILLVEKTPEKGNYGYLSISIKNGNNTLGQLGIGNLTSETVNQFIDKKKNDKLSKLLTEIVLACCNVSTGSTVKSWVKGKPFYVNKGFLYGSSTEIQGTKENEDILLKDEIIKKLLGENELTDYFNTKVIVNIVKVGRRYGYIKKCKGEPLNNDSYYAKLNGGIVEVTDIHITNNDNKDKGNCNAITIKTLIDGKKFNIFIGSDRAEAVKSILKLDYLQNSVLFNNVLRLREAQISKSADSVREITEMMAEKVGKHINQLTGKPDKLYHVGGCIRDELIGKEPDDFDLITTMYYKDYAKLFDTEDIRFRGRQIIVVPVVSGEEMETGMITKNQTIERNLAARDLTINSIARDILTGEIIDPEGGQEDLVNELLRATSITKDLLSNGQEPVRFFRIIGFYGRTGWDIEDETFDCLADFCDLNHGRCKMTSRQFHHIWDKVVKAGGEDRALDLCDELGLDLYEYLGD